MGDNQIEVEENEDFSGLSDVVLLEKSIENPDVFGFLVERYQAPLGRYIRRISYFSKEDVEDLLQEVFIKIYKNLNAFDRKLKFSAWAYRITHNAVVDEIRKRRARPQGWSLDDGDLLKILGSKVDLEREAKAKDFLQKARQIIDGLPLKYREALVLRFLEQKSYEEMMDILKKPKGTVAALINRARKKLTKEAQKQDLVLDF